ncbi:hypothetical protein J4H69_06165 [Vibrio alginolyticus]|uniref:hypothetical protein n=1 Tax=Vibrio alginolyticus TaxID=663 RepID=UPI001BD379DB|nr:hypothetical protein [Vibrio alginolyticus]MBT0065521.1 hypothetical protein [Vibrio alginolyticus]
MSIFPSLKNPNDLLLKLCRESINVYTSQKDEEVLDRFFNFCITAHSLRDWVIKSSGIDKNTVHDYCNTYDSLKMCRDIANANKHFGLDSGKISSVSAIDEKELSYRPMALGEIDTKTIVKKPSLEVLDQNGNKINLKDFMNNAIEAWVDVFDHFSITRDQKLFYTRSLEIEVGGYVITLI